MKQHAHNQQDTRQPLELQALDRVTLHHARTCTYWIFSGDRRCSCGRDQARAELEKIRKALEAGILIVIGAEVTALFLLWAAA